jgi:hypothetical protein
VGAGKTLAVGGALTVTGSLTGGIVAPLESPTFTGTPVAPTAAPGTSTTQIATTAFVQAAATPAFPSGTAMMFVQTEAPTGWTKSTEHNDKALRVVSGTVGSGGSAAFTTAFGTPSVSGSVSLSGTVGNHTLTTAQLASHNHTVTRGGDDSGPQGTANSQSNPNIQLATSSTGGNSAHNHSFSGSGSLSAATATINVQYVDVIIATKD